MKFYKDENNKIYAFKEDGSQDEFIGSDLTAITKKEADNIRFPFSTKQEAKITEIKSKFIEATKAGFKCTNGITMDADLIDIITLKAGYDLTVSLGADKMSITDFNNDDHTDIAIADVFTMIQELGVNYETLRVKKNTLRKQAKDATDQAGLDEVVW